jgi:hypothetical protein
MTHDSVIQLCHSIALFTGVAAAPPVAESKATTSSVFTGCLSPDLGADIIVDRGIGILLMAGMA